MTQNKDDGREGSFSQECVWSVWEVVKSSKWEEAVMDRGLREDFLQDQLWALADPLFNCKNGYSVILFRAFVRPNYLLFVKALNSLDDRHHKQFKG